MSKKYGFGLKLAAVAVAVAGVFGAVWAAPNFPSGEAVANFTFDNPFVGTISWAKGPFADGKTVGNVDVLLTTDFTKGNIGNVGVLAINTNGNHWDVKLTSKYGGRLYTDGKDTVISDQYPSGCGWSVLCKDTTITKPGDALAYKGLGTVATTGDRSESIDFKAASDTLVVLDVAIGAAQQTVAGAFYSVGCGPSGGSVVCGSAPTPTRIGKVNVTETGSMVKSDRTSGAGTSSDGVSFAKAIGADLATNTNLATQTNFLGLDMTGNGTPLTATDVEGGFIGASPNDQFIYINVGVHPLNSSSIAADGVTTYKETFTFTLYNGY